jgi:hypothetical protein
VRIPARITPYPTGRLFWGGAVPGTSCLATISLSLRDKGQSPIEGPRIKLALTGFLPWAESCRPVRAIFSLTKLQASLFQLLSLASASPPGSDHNRSRSRGRARYRTLIVGGQKRSPWETNENEGIHKCFCRNPDLGFTFRLDRKSPVAFAGSLSRKWRRRLSVSDSFFLLYGIAIPL